MTEVPGAAWNGKGMAPGLGAMNSPAMKAIRKSTTLKIPHLISTSLSSPRMTPVVLNFTHNLKGQGDFHRNPGNLKLLILKILNPIERPHREQSVF
jgi:hypothetical protein